MADNNPFTSGIAAGNPGGNMVQNLVAPDLVAQQMSIARQQQLAQLLLQKSLQDNGKTEMVSGWAVPTSPWQNVGKLIGALGSIYKQNKLDQDTAKMNGDLAKRMAAYIPGGLGGFGNGQDGSANQPMSKPIGGISGGDGLSSAFDSSVSSQAQPQQSPQNTGITVPNLSQNQNLVNAQNQQQGMQQRQPIQSMQSGQGYGPNMQQILQAGAAGAFGGDEAAKAYWNWNAPTEAARRDRELGITPQLAAQLDLAKRRTDAIMSARNGQTLVDFTSGKPTPVFTAPNQDTGSQLVWGPDGTVSEVQIPGSTARISANEAAKAQGQNSQTLAPQNMLHINPDGTYNPTTIGNVINGMPSNNQVRYTDIDQKYGFPPGTMNALIMQESGGNPRAVSPAGAQGLTQMMPATQRNPGYGLGPLNPNNPEDGAKYLAKMRELSGGDLAGGLAKYNAGPAGNPNNHETRNYVNNIVNGIAKTYQQTKQPQQQQSAGIPFGMQESAQGNVKTMNQLYDALAQSNTNAPVILDALQNIKKYAPGSITGASADRREYVNALEALIPGFSSAKDTQAKTDLLKKNMNRLVGAASNYPGATDAARTIAEASNPHQGMNNAAIQEASDQLIGIANMNLDKQKLLENYKLNNNIQGMAKVNQTFQQNADPRLWQLKNMNTQDQKQFMSKLSPSEQQELKRRYFALKQLGVF